MQMEAEAERLFRPIETALIGKLPTDDTFELGIPVNGLRGLRRKELAEIQKAIAAWVEAIAPTVPRAPYGRYLRSIKKVQPAAVPFAVRLDRFQPVFGSGRFMIKHSLAEADLPELRAARIRSACEKKFPKLEVWRRDYQARTILVLEDNDIQLTNPQRVFDTLASMKKDFTNQPDEIHLVSSIGDRSWFVHALRVDNRDYYELSEDGECLTEFDAAQLVDVTGSRP
jgi:hypothetical protein